MSADILINNCQMFSNIPFKVIMSATSSRLSHDQIVTFSTSVFPNENLTKKEKQHIWALSSIRIIYWMLNNEDHKLF